MNTRKALIKAAKVYGIAGAVYAGAWVVDRAIRMSKHLQGNLLYPDATAGEFAAHVASDLLLWPVHAFHVLQNVHEAVKAGTDYWVQVPVVGAIRLPAVIDLAPATSQSHTAGLRALGHGTPSFPLPREMPRFLLPPGLYRSNLPQR